ncbi:MAG: HIT family protein [Chloroflexi bacterium]|nr:HIT family protein [Chloroflexota bacterium]
MTAQRRPRCIFCAIAAGEAEAAVVLEDERFLAFLDHRPVFHGHALLIPREHAGTLPDLPSGDAGPLLQRTQLLARAVPQAMAAEGSFVAINNGVSQSVPHLHVHVVPRSRGDGLRGFFWPRHPYENASQLRETAERVRAAVDELRADEDGEPEARA